MCLCLCSCPCSRSRSCSCSYLCLCLCLFLFLPVPVSLLVLVFFLVTHERKQPNISVSQGGSKLEKAEVLELTVDYVRNLIRKGKQLILRVIP